MNKVRRLREAIAEHGRQCDQIDRDHYQDDPYNPSGPDYSYANTTLWAVLDDPELQE